MKSTNECLLWIKLDKCFFHIDSDLFLCLAYNVPKGNTKEHLNDINMYDLIAHDMLHIEHTNGTDCH